MRRRKLIDENPFDGVKAAATGIKDRQRFVTRDEIARVLAACPDHHWRAIVALARYGGLRCPSEVLSLRWQDVDWDAGRIVVQSPKTEHHAGKASRTIPLFPELRPILDEAFDLAPDGAVYVVDEKFRKAAMGPAGWMNANLRTHVREDRQARRPDALAPAVPQPAGEPRNGTGRNLSGASGHELAGQHAERGHAALPDDDRRTFRRGREGRRTGGRSVKRRRKRRRMRRSSARRVSRRARSRPAAAHEKTPVLPGFASSCEFDATTRNGGDRIRTCDLEVMSLASYRAAPPRVKKRYG